MDQLNVVDAAGRRFSGQYALRLICMYEKNEQAEIGATRLLRTCSFLCMIGPVMPYAILITVLITFGDPVQPIGVLFIGIEQNVLTTHLFRMAAISADLVGDNVIGAWPCWEIDMG